MNPLIEQIALTLSSGTGSHSTVIFSQGSPTAPFSVGKNGDWRVQARGVEALHLYLCFDGERAYVAAASEQARVFVPGAQVGCSWVPLVVPSRLWFGTACLVIQAQSSNARSASDRPLRAFAAGTVRLPDFSQADEPQTRILDLTAAGMRKTQRFDTPESMLALLREADREPQNVAPQTLAGTGAAAQRGAAASSKDRPERIEPASNRAGHATALLDLARTVPSFEPVPVTTTTVIFSSPSGAPAAPAALTSTLYDGGRLRDYAARLAANAPSPTEPAAPEHSAATSHAEGSVSSQPPVVLARRSSQAKPGRIALALRVGGLCLGLLGIASVWSRQQSAKANPSLTHLATAAPSGAALTAAAPAPAAHPAPPSAPRPQSAPAVPAASAAAAGSALVAPTLSAAHSEVSAAPSAARSLTAVPSPSAIPSSNAAQPAASAGATQAATAPENAELASTEHAAFAAAFSGNDSAAAALYAKLAADSHSRTFELAARLAREGRIRKP